MDLPAIPFKEHSMHYFEHDDIYAWKTIFRALQRINITDNENVFKTADICITNMRFQSWELIKNHMSEIWLEPPHKLRHGPLLRGWWPWDMWEVLKHLSVSCLFLISISEKSDLIKTGLCVNCDKYMGDVKFMKFENLRGFLSVFTTRRWPACPLKQ